MLTLQFRKVTINILIYHKVLAYNSSAQLHKRNGSSSTTNVERTALYDFHVKHGGKIVNFGGFALPITYADQGIATSHLHTRRNASIFDVSHMLQTYVRGRDAIVCMESVCTADISRAEHGSGMLTVFTNESGGILDDLIVTKVNNELLYVVSNAAMKKQDMDIMKSAVNKCKEMCKDVTLEFLPSSEQSLIAVQGPKAVNILSKLMPVNASLNQLHFMETMTNEIAGVPNCRITRCGYTGEDGVEISVSSDRVQHITEGLLSADLDMKLAGLGARDSMRLEAGLCLYGSDINVNTTPIEAGLSWLIAERRRNKLDFPGAQRICEQVKRGVTRRRIGLKMSKSNMPPAREGVEIYYHDNCVGQITSGCPSPSMGINIAMGYIKEGLNKPGQSVLLKIRNNFYDAIVVKMPFIKTNYFIKKLNQ